MPVSGVVDLDRLPYNGQFYQPNRSTQERSSIEQFRPRSTLYITGTPCDISRLNKNGTAVRQMVRGNKALHLKMSYGEDDGSAEQDAAEQLNSQLKYYCPFRGQHDEA